jgi:branched-chain amino acid transport system ATP-binding protein
MTLTVTGLDGWYGPAQALFGVSLQVKPGEALALLGRNGAGKSTTLRAIMGLLDRRRGQVIFDGEDISQAPSYDIARRGLGYVPEDRRIFAGLTVEENLSVGRQKPRPGAPVWTPQRIYDLFPNLGAMRHRLGGRMSGGEQQMLAIGRTLMGNARMMLLDEPSEGLAPKIVEQMAAAILLMKRDGIGLLLSEQNLPFARLICDRVSIIEQGKTRFTGSLTALDADPSLARRYLAV